MRKIAYTSPAGDYFELTSRDEPRVQLNEGGVSGLVASPDVPVASSVVGVGQVPTGLSVAGMSGSLSGLIVGQEGGEVAGLYRRWRRAWSVVKPGVLQVSTGDGSWVSTPVRAASIPDWVGKDEWDLVEIPWSVSVVSDAGLWFGSPMWGEGSVTVTNIGDVNIHPKIRWKGAGGQVILPSGASFTLPVTSSERVLLLDPLESLAVVDNDDILDRALWPIAGAISEGVPPGESRIFTVPTGARLEWRVPLFDPWK